MSSTNRRKRPSVKYIDALLEAFRQAQYVVNAAKFDGVQLAPEYHDVVRALDRACAMWNCRLFAQYECAVRASRLHLAFADAPRDPAICKSISCLRRAMGKSIAPSDDGIFCVDEEGDAS